MVSLYGSGLMGTPLLAAAGCGCLCNNTSLLNNMTTCIQLASQDPTFWHLVGVLPMCAGGFMLTSNVVRAMRLWMMELWDLKKRRS